MAKSSTQAPSRYAHIRDQLVKTAGDLCALDGDAAAEDTAIQLTLARLLRQVDAASAADPLYELVLARDPGNQKVLLDHMASAFEQQQLETAVTRIDAVLAHAPNDAALLLRKSATYRSLGQRDKAVEALQPLCDALPEPYALRGKLAANLQALGEHASARVVFASQVAERPKDKDAHLGLVNCALSMGNVDDAINECRAALEKLPREHMFKERMASAFLLARQPQEAIEQIKLMPRSISRSTKIQLTLARAYRADKNLPKAAKVYKQVLKQEPDEYTALIGQIDVALGLKRYALARRLCDELLDRQPDNNAAFQRKLRVLEEAGKTADAIALLDAKLKTAPKDRPLRLSLARAHLARRNYAQADELCAQILADGPDAEAVMLQSEIAEARGDQEAAKAVLEQHLSDAKVKTGAR